MVKRMYRKAKDDGLTVKSPKSITYAYDELRTAPQQQTQYREAL